MKSTKIIQFTAIPFLLIVTITFAYYTILKNWNFEISSYIIFLFTTIYILLLERIIPLKVEWKSRKSELWTDVKHFIFSTTLFDALGKTVALAFVLYLQHYYFKPNEIWSAFPFIVTFLIANIIGEFFPYLYHRISHHGSNNSAISMFLWKIHSIHHIPISLNWFKTNWIHPINIFLNAVLKIAPLLLLGFTKDIVFLVGITHVVIAYLSHANIKTKTGFLDYLIVTPQVHHFHHSKLLNEAKNFGNIIPLWDLIFGTYYNRKGEVDTVGVIEGNLSYPKKENYLHQLTFPFHSTLKKCC
jgi:sterol desaturase/sphingolipid hydroxylase (fatty acid hydroxylase superfamily)